jgi:hypothetical protein
MERDLDYKPKGAVVLIMSNGEQRSFGFPNTDIQRAAALILACEAQANFLGSFVYAGPGGYDFTASPRNEVTLTSSLYFAQGSIVYWKPSVASAFIDLNDTNPSLRGYLDLRIDASSANDSWGIDVSNSVGETATAEFDRIDSPAEMMAIQSDTDGDLILKSGRITGAGTHIAAFSTVYVGPDVSYSSTRVQGTGLRRLNVFGDQLPTTFEMALLKEIYS